MTHIGQWQVSELRRFEKIGLLTFVVVGVVGAIALAPQSVNTLAVAADIALTLTFLLFAWRPEMATAAILAVAIIYAVVGSSGGPLLALVLACCLVVRTCRTSVIVGYMTVTVLGYATVVTLNPLTLPLESAPALLLGALVASGLGYALRTTVLREEQLMVELQAQEEANRNVVRQERQRMTDELHDVIAHDVTIISMHARILARDIDQESRDQSRQAIEDSARHALADIRLLVDPVAADSNGGETDVAGAILQAERVLTVSGFDVSVTNTVADEAILNRMTVAALVRVTKESTTNILKHAAAGNVTISLTQCGGKVRLMIGNDRVSTPRSHRGGYGTVRMRERVERLGGVFSAAPDGRGWLVDVCFTLA